MKRQEFMQIIEILKNFHLGCIFLFLLGTTPLNCLSQLQLGFEYDPSIPVTVNAQQLTLAWAGGINYGQFSSIDYNYDGLQDLVIFDRSGDEFILLEQQSISGNSSYKYVYNAANLFPNDCKYRSAFVDYNNDAKADLFTYGIGGVKVYKNTGNSTVGLQWTLVKPILNTNYLGTLTNLFVSAGDIPAYVDVDSDGDIDVLTFHLGGQNLEYHQNQSMELYGIPDSLTFVLKNQCWGKFSEDPSGNSLTLNQTAYPCSNGDIANPEYPIHDTLFIFDESKLHVGSTVLAIDLNGNGVKDLILGDVAYSTISQLTNGGSTPNTNSAMISQTHDFPNASNPAYINTYPASYYVDVDFDGINDLIIAPNARTISENQQSVQFFKNSGTNNIPVFNYQTNSFLQNEMIDAGLGSIPTLVDVDGDGLQDLVLSHFFRYKPVLNKETALTYYRNTGTALIPAFTEASTDLFGFSSQALGLRLVPTFGDLDNDGDSDLILGSEYGTLSLYTNIAGPGNPISLAASTPLSDDQGTAIQVDAYAFPQLFDLNNDGLLDLIIGKKTGEIVYYKNIGTLNNAKFKLVTNNLGNVDISPNPDGYAAPHFFRVQDTTYLFVGSYTGNLAFFTQIDSNLTDGASFNLVSSNYLSIDVGLYSSFFVGDIDQDSNLNLFVGQDLGGLFHFEVNPNSTASFETPKIQNPFTLFPNPGNQQITIHGNTPFFSFDVYSILGQKQTVQKHQNTFDVSNLSKGMYIVVITTESGIVQLNFQKL